MIEITKVSRSKFESELVTVNRIWDGKQGLSKKQATQKGIDIDEDMDFIFIRNDGWSIATTEINYDSCHDLWPNSWAIVYTFDNVINPYSQQ